MTHVTYSVNECFFLISIQTLLKTKIIRSIGNRKGNMKHKENRKEKRIKSVLIKSVRINDR